MRVRTRSDVLLLRQPPSGRLDSDQPEDAGYEATAAFPDVCFVPVASAVDLADPSDPFAPVTPWIRPQAALTSSVASQNKATRC